MSSYIKVNTRYIVLVGIKKYDFPWNSCTQMVSKERNLEYINMGYLVSNIVIPTRYCQSPIPRLGTQHRSPLNPAPGCLLDCGGVG